MEKMRALSKAQFAQSGFDTSDYHFITEPGTFTAYLELKVWGKRSLECFFTFVDGRKIIACTFQRRIIWALRIFRLVQI